MKRNILLFFINAAVILFLITFENKFNITGISIGYVYAMIFCKKNPFTLFIPYVSLSIVFTFTLSNIFYTLLSVLPIIILSVFHYFFNKKYKLWVTVLLVMVSQTIKFYLYDTYVDQIISTTLAAVFFYICVVFLYPFTVKGIRRELSNFEKTCLYIFVGTIGGGIFIFSLLPFSLFYAIATGVTIILSYFDKQKILPVILSMGLGASLFSLTFLPLGYCVVLSFLYILFSSVHRVVGGITMLLGYVAAVYYIEKNIPLLTVLPVFVCSFLVFLPQKIFASINVYYQSQKGKFALRSVVNKDRERVKKKLEKVSDAFDTIQKILTEEENVFPGEEEITKQIKNRICSRCVRKEKCSDTVDFGIKNLVTSAMENGKATMLDIGTALSEKCIKVPKLLYSINEAVEINKVESEKRSGLIQGKEMVIAELSGTAELLRTMASEIETGIGFDIKTEERIKEELVRMDILASDVALCGSGKEGVTLIVRKKDAENNLLKEILSSAIGEELTETERTEGIGGTVSLTFRQAPMYGLIYGESSVSAQKECGDSRQTVKLSYDKIMFVLSDGMGTGNEAEKTAENAVKLLKSFYLAGFDHRTVFGCVSKLLSLRKQEDFSALDVAVFDTQCGAFDFIKQGGRESYVLSDGNLDLIEGCSLPLGIIEEADPQIIHRKMRGGDIVIMISDGVADRLHYSDMIELLNQCHTINPQIIAEKITSAAAQKEGKKDDMTSIVMRIVKNKREN